MADTVTNGYIAVDSGALNELNNTDARNLLDTIDSLRELQVGDIISLPQIIVVGAQSSGKSSVLEAISHMRFPTDGGLCTRFATELILRRAPKTTLDVSIKFANEQGQAQAKPFHMSGFSKNDLPNLVNQAKEHMGIREGGKEFSNDVLRIKISGPEMYPLTLVDLPGLYEGSTADQSRQGVRFVNLLIDRYMSQRKSIILAVVSANYNLAHQKILDETQKHDPARERTLGIITKPDLAGVADQRHFIQLAQNQEAAHKLSLGWHVLRNRGESKEEQELLSDERDVQEETFFKDSSWKSVLSVNWGVANLRRKLSKVLLEHIRRTLPDLVREIETRLKLRTDELERFGMSRSTPEELRSYLFDISRQYERLASNAVEGRYSDPFFGDLYTRKCKLRALIRNLNRAFDITLSTKGASNKFEWYNSCNDTDDEDPVPEYLEPFLAEYEFPDPEPKDEAEVNAELEESASINQGRELPGSPNNGLVIELFKMQAKPWREIADFHIAKVLNVTKAVVEQMFIHIIGADKKTVQALLSIYVDPFFDMKEEILRTKLEELLRPYVSGYGLPLETDFHKRVSKRGISRLANHLASLLEDEHSEAFQDKHGKALTRKKILQTIANAEDLQNSKFGTERVIDMMMVYYEMALGTFIDNVINLAIENCLVDHVPTVLTTAEVDKMSEATLSELASESEEVQAQRQMLQDQVKILRDGLQKCKRYRPREVTDLPSSFSALSPSTARKLPNSRSVSPSPTPSQPAKPPSVSSLIPPPTTSKAASPTFSFGLVPGSSNNQCLKPQASMPSQGLFGSSLSTAPSLFAPLDKPTLSNPFPSVRKPAAPSLFNMSSDKPADSPSSPFASSNKATQSGMSGHTTPGDFSK